MKDYDAIIVGAGPAGSSVAIRLAQAGWSVALVEKHTFPRRKVCGECVAASNLPLIDALGIGTQFAAMAGPELRRVGLFAGNLEIIAPLPPFGNATNTDAQHAWGRALGREHLDMLLLQRAKTVGADIRQPCSARSFEREGDLHVCHIRNETSHANTQLRAPILIRAHGSWEPDPMNEDEADESTASVRQPHRGSDLFAFKGNYRRAHIEPGLLPVLAFAGGYGGMVLGDHGLATLAFCVRRDALQRQRARNPGCTAAIAALRHVRERCVGVARALDGAEPVERWLAVGPIRPGIRAAWRSDDSFAIGNVAGEAHPILGEGISMALQSAWLLGDVLITNQRHLRGNSIHKSHLNAAGRDYAHRWRQSFTRRIRFAALCAQFAMRPDAARMLLPLVQRRPAILTWSARVAGKVRPLAVGPGSHARRNVSTGGHG